MFEINFISDPGLQEKTSNDCWSFLHKRKQHVEEKNIDHNNLWFSINNLKFNNIFYRWIPLFIIIFISFMFYFSVKPIQHSAVLNQVIDLIIESGYMKDMQLEKAYFSSNSVKVTVKADELKSLQNFVRGYRSEDKIPFEIFKKKNISYMSLDFPWEGSIRNGSMDELKSLATKTVFSNKISIKYTENKFELDGRASDIISFLLQMAENSLIQQYTLSLERYQSGDFNLRIQAS